MTSDPLYLYVAVQLTMDGDILNGVWLNEADALRDAPSWCSVWEIRPGVLIDAQDYRTVREGQ